MWYFNSGEESWLSSWVAASNLSGNAGTGLWTALSADTPPRMGWRTTAADSNSLALSTWQLPRGLDAAASIPAGDTTGACGMLKPLPGGGFAVGLASCGAAIAPFACKRGQQWNGPPASHRVQLPPSPPPPSPPPAGTPNSLLEFVRGRMTYMLFGGTGGPATDWATVGRLTWQHLVCKSPQGVRMVCHLNVDLLKQ